jgi:hypothetical protein
LAHRNKFGRTTFGRKWTRQEDAGETPAPIPIDLPLRIRRSAEAFSILDASERAVCHVCFEDDQDRRQALRRFTEAEARQISQTIARMLSDADAAAAGAAGAGKAGGGAGRSLVPLEDLSGENDE